MTKVCKRHANNPVMIYHQCIGCELEWFHEELEQKQQEIERLQQERAELIKGLRSIRNELDRLSRESRQKWKHEGDMYEQGRADAYDEADMLIRDILKECEVTVE